MMATDGGLTRRGWIGAAGFAALAVGGAKAATVQRDFDVVAGSRSHDYGTALRALSGYAAAELDAVGLPGMTLCVTDTDGFTATLGLGWADVEGRVPVNSRQLFQIGSISKSFIAITVLALADQGKIDLEAPVSRYLQEVPLPLAPITVAQLLSHTSGLPDGAPIFPRGGDSRLWTGFAPGSKFSYSNTGFELLGRVIERVTGVPFAEAVSERVSQKLKLRVAGTISQAQRKNFAVGYWPWDETIPSLPGARLERALFDEEDTPAGSVGANSEQMSIYLRALLAIGRGEGAPILSNAMARRFATPVTNADDIGPGIRYALGVMIATLDDAPSLHHTGGMMSFSSSFHADPAAGVACFASVNARLGEYRPRLTTSYAVRLMRAVRHGDPLPPPPDPLAPWRLNNPKPYLGTYRTGVSKFVVEESPQGPTITSDGFGANGDYPQGRLMRIGKDRFATDNPELSDFAFDPVFESGKVTALWWGDELWRRDDASGAPPSSKALEPFAGVYLNRDPWVGQVTVLVRGDRLFLEGRGWLEERGDWWSTEDDPGGIERLRFDGLINGKYRRLNVSGSDLQRILA